MRFNTDKPRRQQWHLWFAWHPVWVGSTMVWGERVWRRWVVERGSDDWSRWEYALVEVISAHVGSQHVSVVLLKPGR